MKHLWRCLLSTSTLALLFCCCGMATGQQWTRFRGPNGQGISEATTIPANWTGKDYNWRVKLPGMGYSSPVIWGERIFITCGIEEDATQIIRCLRTSDGELIWKRSFPSTTHPKHKFNCYASATPVLDEQNVYMVWATPEAYTLLALDQAKGEEVWRRDLGPFVAEHGNGASPMLFEDMIIVPNDQDGSSSVIAVDRLTGQTRWQVERRTKKTAYSTPVIYRPDAGVPQLITISWAHGINSLDPYTGSTNWEQDVLRYRVVGSPTIAGGLIFASCGSGGVGKQMVAVRPGDPDKGADAEVAYELEKVLPYVPTSVAKGNLLFTWYDRGVVTCLDAPTGAIHWRQRVGGTYFGSPVRVADRLYCISRDGELVVLAASEEFELLGRIDLEEPSKSTPAVAGGVMYLRTISHLMAIGGKASSPASAGR